MHYGVCVQCYDAHVGDPRYFISHADCAFCDAHKPKGPTDMAVTETQQRAAQAVFDAASALVRATEYARSTGLHVVVVHRSPQATTPLLHIPECEFVVQCAVPVMLKASAPPASNILVS